MEIRSCDETYCPVLFCRDVYITGSHQNGKNAAERGLDLKIYAIAEQALRDELDSHSGEIIAVLLGRRCALSSRKIRNLPTNTLSLSM
jgi:hypothetical protein